MFKRYVCPHCYERFKPREAIYECPTCAQSTTVGGAQFGPSRLSLLDRLYVTLVDLKSIQFCPLKNHESTCVPLCPRCKKEFFYDLIGNDNIIVSIVGGTDSGKSIFLTVLMHEMYSSISHHNNYSFNNLGDTHVGFEAIENGLYKRGALPGSTRHIEQEGTSGRPLVYLFKNSREYKKVLVPIFYDATGEDLMSTEKSRRYYHYIVHSKGLIFFADISSDKGIQITNNTLSAATQVLRQGRGIAATAKIDTPIVVVVPKADLILDELQAHDPLFKTYERWPSLEQINSMSTAFESYLATKNPTLSNNISHNFSSYRYLPVSALGIDPGGRETIDPAKIKPMWIEYPLVYFIRTFLGN